MFYSAVQKHIPGKGPGEMGAPVKIPKDKEKESKKMFKENQFNLMASNMISLNRTLKGTLYFLQRNFIKPQMSECRAVRNMTTRIWVHFQRLPLFLSSTMKHGQRC